MSECKLQCYAALLTAHKQASSPLPERQAEQVHVQAVSLTGSSPSSSPMRRMQVSFAHATATCISMQARSCFVHHAPCSRL